MNKLYNNIGFKIFIIILIIVLLLLWGYGSLASQNIDKLAYVVAIGIDEAPNNNLKLSVQLAKPASSSGSDDGGSSSSSQSTSSVISSVECSSFESGINLLNSYISRDINLSHCKVIVMSEKIAVQDISSFLYDFANNVELSSQANVIVTKCEANEFLRMSHPMLDSFAARYYETAPRSSKFTGFTKAVSLMDFFSNCMSSDQEAVAILGNVNTESTHKKSIKLENFANKDTAYVAGETPITSDNAIENMGIAVFKDYQLVGELNGLESICHMMVSGDLNSCNMQIKDPKDETKNIDINIKQQQKSKKTVKFINGFPYIKIELKLNARLLSISANSDYSNHNYIERLENEISTYLEDIISDYLYKVSKQYNADIDGFGKSAKAHFLTLDEWDNYDWGNNYKNSFFDISVKTKIKSGYIFTST